jgi:hypothetical protein
MIRHLLLLILLASTVTACADLVRPSAPPVIPRTTVSADPPDARCRLANTTTREDLQPTPFSIETLAVGLPVTITCERPGFQATAEVLRARPVPRLAAALADGAVLSPMASDEPPPGVRADSPVPATLTVSLRPALFSTPTARDRYYQRLRGERQARWDGFAARLEAECTAQPGLAPTSGTADCKAARSALAQQRDGDLRLLEIARRRSTFQ